MSEQDSTQASTKKRRGSQSNKQKSLQAPTLLRPMNQDKEAWKGYWRAQGQSWRTEPEIDKKRQEELERYRTVAPNIMQGIYPFRGEKLSREDLEWLLATHDNGSGPVDYSDASQRNRRGLDLRGADLRQVDLRNLPLARIYGGLPWDEWEQANEEQRKMGAVLMEGADLRWAHLQQADLDVAHLEGADLRSAQLDGVDLEGARLGDEKHISPRLADIRWGDMNLTVVNWTSIKMLGDEHVARQNSSSGNGELKRSETRFNEYDEAVRANRQLTAVLRDQGLNEEADYFAYRAQRLKRIVLRRLVYLPHANLQQRVRALGSYIFSLFLDILAGYGYHPAKTLLWYLLVIGGFATAYSILGHIPPLPDSLVFSLMSFHGRGFFPSLSSETNLHNPLVLLAAAEAVIGLFIEISFIATFTQRFFGK